MLGIICLQQGAKRFLWKLIRRRFRILAPPKAAQSCQKKSGAAEGGKIIEEKSLPPTKAGESLKKQAWRRWRQYKGWKKFDALEDGKNIEELIFRFGFSVMNNK